MDSIRESFVEQFSEADAIDIETAIKTHIQMKHIWDTYPGDDAFKRDILFIIGYECVSKDSYRKQHKIKLNPREFKQWCIDFGDLGSHTGDHDVISMFAGVYDEYMPTKEPL